MLSQNPVRSVLAGALLSLIASGLVVAAQAQQGPSAVGVETVETRTLSETLPVFGEVVATSDSSVATRVAGIVQEVSVLVGDRVAEGDTLALLDRELAQIEFDQAAAAQQEAEAGIEVAEARLALANDALERVTGLQGTTSFSSARFDETTSGQAEASGLLAQAQARLSNANAALARAEYNLVRARITAPFDAVVLSVDATAGQFLTVGSPVARLLDISTLEVQANVQAEYVAALSEGLTVAGQTEDGAPLSLTVRAILPTESQTTRTRPVRFDADLSNGSRPVALGQSLTVSVPIDTPRDVLSVPKDALVQGAQGWTVFLVEEGAAQPRTVQIGVAMSDRFEVLSGLAEGDVVVVRGNERLRPGQPVAPMGADSAPAKSN